MHLLEALLRPCSIPIGSETSQLPELAVTFLFRVAVRPRFGWQRHEDESRVMERSGEAVNFFERAAAAPLPRASFKTA